MRYSNKFYTAYIFCLTIIVGSSSGVEGALRFIPVSLLFLYFLAIIFNDFKGLVSAVMDSKYVFAFVILMFIGILRSNVQGIIFNQIIANSLSVLLFYLCTCHALKHLLIHNDTKRILNIILIPFLVLAVLNLGLYALGFSKPSLVAKDMSKMMAAIGIANKRVNFFLVDGVNSYGSINGACLAISILALVYNIYKKIFIVPLIVIFLIINFLTDCRGAFGFVLFSALISWFIQKGKRLKLLNLIPYFGVLAPLIFVFLLPFLAENFTFLSRGGNDLATGNSRLTMWKMIYNDFVSGSTFLPFGFGDAGLYKTHAYNGISAIFSEVKNDIVINPQNSLIAIILDFGYLALIAYTVILFTGIGKIKDRWFINPQLYTILISLLLYLILIGITEAVIGMYYNNAYVIFLYIFCFMSLIPKKIQLKFKLTTTT